MPFHQAFTAGLSPELLMSSDIQQAGLGHAVFPAGLQMQHCLQYICILLLTSEGRFEVWFINHNYTL